MRIWRFRAIRDEDMETACLRIERDNIFPYTSFYGPKGVAVYCVNEIYFTLKKGWANRVLI